MSVSLSCLAAATALALAHPTSLHAAGAPADDWATVEKTFKPVAVRPGSATPAEALAGRLKWLGELLAAGSGFFQQHPDDPRRWTGVVRMYRNFESITYGQERWPAASRQTADAVMDAATRAGWKERLAELQRAALVAADTPADVRLYFDSRTLARLSGEAEKALYNQQPADLVPLKAELDRLTAKYSEQEPIFYETTQYMKLRERAGTPLEAQEQEWRQFADSPNPAVRAEAATRLKFFGLRRAPVDLAFTAVDGRAVDLKKLRGKVVLLDFWATWCMPCLAELPNVQKVYAKYHDQGFEIVGIALENARLDSADTPEQREQKLAAARQVLTAFTAEHNMPWPQHMDGKYWKTDLARKYIVNSVPAPYLLDQNGMIVTLHASGETLEAEVRRLLKL